MTEKKRGRTHSPGRRPPPPRGDTFCVLRRTRAELERRFGAPLSGEEPTLVFADGADPLRANRLHVFLRDDGTVKLARVELATPVRLRPEKLFEIVARFNGGHVGMPELLPHTLAGGLRAWHFAGSWWAFPQKDEAGCVFGVKLWQEPL